MKSYNGFTANQRNKAQAWLRKQWSEGVLSRPSKCCSCAITKGIIDAHAEDYSEPFAAGKTDQYHLCYRCHMMLHCRKHNSKHFLLYCALVCGGTQFQPFYTRDWGRFSRQMLDEFNPPIHGVSIATTNILYTIHANISNKH